MNIMEDADEKIEVVWTVEELDNGIVLEDEDSLAKEAAVEGRRQTTKKVLNAC